MIGLMILPITPVILIKAVTDFFDYPVEDFSDFLSNLKQASENFTHPNASIDQYIVVLRISTLFMTTLISCTSKTLLDRNRS